MSWRRLWLLIAGLLADPHSLTAAAADMRTWTITDYLLADLRALWGGPPNPLADRAKKAARGTVARKVAAGAEKWQQRKAQQQQRKG